MRSFNIAICFKMRTKGKKKKKKGKYGYRSEEKKREREMGEEKDLCMIIIKWQLWA